jgi:hypothetical protein
VPDPGLVDVDKKLYRGDHPGIIDILPDRHLAQNEIDGSRISRNIDAVLAVREVAVKAMGVLSDDTRPEAA